MALEAAQLNKPVPSGILRLGPVVTLAIIWLVLILILGFGADWVSPFDPATPDLHHRLDPPLLFGGTWEHVLGTDHLGRDIFSRLCHAIRISLLIALIGTVVGAILGTALGFLATHLGGLWDDGLMVLIDFQAAMPFLIIALAAIAFLGGSIVVLLMLVSLYGWERYARLARSLALTATQEGYAEAALAYGARPARVYLHHILPNVAGVLLINMTLNFPETVLLESSLSFLGLGVQPPTASLGSMLNYGRDYLMQAWWISVLPGMTIFLTTLSVSLLGDALRDKLTET